jgi:hypothetical protein
MQLIKRKRPGMFLEQPSKTAENQYITHFKNPTGSAAGLCVLRYKKRLFQSVLLYFAPACEILQKPPTLQLTVVNEVFTFSTLFLVF